MSTTGTRSESRPGLGGHEKEIPDRIFVRDYVLDCHIGVYDDEKDVTQKVSFSIEAAVASHVGSDRDDIVDVPSYDNLVGAVNDTLNAGHINLVETMAEQIADQVLKDARIVWTKVRIEKLERGPGAVGIEILRPRNALGA